MMLKRPIHVSINRIYRTPNIYFKSYHKSHVLYQEKNDKSNNNKQYGAFQKTQVALVKGFHEMRELTKFYWEGTKLWYGDVKKFNQLRKEIAYRNLRTADRRETMFLNNQTIDIFKMVPALTLFMIPFGTVLLPLYAYLFPVLLPSTFQSPALLKQSHKNHYKIRKIHSAMVIDSFLKMTNDLMEDPKQSHTHVEALKINTLINHVVDSRNYDTGTRNFIDVSVQVLKELQELDLNPDGLFNKQFSLSAPESIISANLLGHMVTFLMVTQHEYNGISCVGPKQVNAAISGIGSGAINLPLKRYTIMSWAKSPRFATEGIKRAGLKDYLEMMKYDDIYIKHFGVKQMTLWELLQALYVRGLNVHEQGDMKKFTVEELQELMSAWTQFSANVKSDSLKVFAQTLLWWQ
ncbi:LETM1 domain-containing protein YLH47, mitochondrial [Acrasis kona]|uniref:LETM1 domain-containing protein YLH47, mitochondrial n=1 Tax=Acrasis kona TaxID=1008807 RepID=A0AAW2ZC90_9EUKA